jgi:chromatin remodeling complex protein RSC6
LIREQETLLKMYKKNSDTEVKKLNGKRKKKSNDGEQKRSGFTKPSKIPNKIAEFLGIDLETVMPRTDVTKKIYEYIKTNNLQN